MMVIRMTGLLARLELRGPAMHVGGDEGPRNEVPRDWSIMWTCRYCGGNPTAGCGDGNRGRWAAEKCPVREIEQGVKR